MMYSESTAWVVTCGSGIATGVILGAQPSVSVAAFVAIALVIALAILACAKLLRPPAH